MANTKVTQHVIANNAITADQIASAAVTDAKLHATLDLSGKTLTLPATAIPSASTATTQAASDNTTKLATTAYVTTAIANLNDSAPSALNTLNELAAALNDDASFSSTITTALGTKLPLAGGTMTGNIAHASDFALDVGGNITLDADGGSVFFKDGGTEFFKARKVGTSHIQLYSAQNDVDIKIEGVDGGVGISALTLDMSEAGFAIFNSGGSFGGTGALKIPAGTTGQRPSAATGQLRWNTTDGKLEIYDGSAWSNVSAGTSNKVLDTFTGNNSTTAFTLTETPANEDALMVFINGAYQEKGDYSLSGKVLTLDVAPLSTEKVIVHTTIGAVHDGTAALNQQFTATAGQTAFTLGADPQHENNTQVYINGVYQQKTDYTVSGTTLTFDTGLTVGDVVEVNSFTVTNLGGTDSVTEGVSNLYHTAARARGAISVSGNALSYNSSSGVLTSNFEESPVFTGTPVIGTSTAGSLQVGSANSFQIQKSGVTAYINQSDSGPIIVRMGSGFAEKLRIDASGNVGIGTAPSTGWVNSADFTALQIGSGLALWGRGSGDHERLGLTANIYHDGSAYKHMLTGRVTSYEQNDGKHLFKYHASQSAGTSVTLTTALTIDTSGNVGIGTGDWSTRLKVLDTSDARKQIEFSNHASYRGSIGHDAASGRNEYRTEAGGGMHAFFRGATSTTPEMQIDNNGRVTKQFQPYIRCAGNSASMVANHGSTADYTNWTNQVQRGITRSGGVFTVPTAGEYMITYSFYNWMNNTGKGVTHGVFLKKGSTSIQETNNEFDMGDNSYSYYDNNINNSIILNMAAGDTFKFTTYADIYGGTTHTNMSAYLLG